MEEKKRICPACGAQAEPGVRFCTYCGKPLPQEAPPEEPQKSVFCHNCGAPISADAVFCPSCGTSVKDAKKAEKRLKKKSAPKKAAPIVIVALLLVAAIAAAVVFLLPRLGIGKSGASEELPGYILYAKDNELQFTSEKKLAPVELTKDLCDQEIGEDFYPNFGSTVAVSSDGKKVLYPDKYTSGMGRITLYYRDLSKNAEPVRIDTDISMYRVTDAFDCVLYLKGDDHTLYMHDLKEKERVAKDVDRFMLIDGEKSIVYVTADGDLYLQKLGKDREKIDRDCDDFRTCKDGEYIFYTKTDGGLYRKKTNEEESINLFFDADGGLRGELGLEKITSDEVEYDYFYPYDSGECYYMTTYTEELPLSSVLADDIAEQDAAMEEPEYPYYSDYSSDEAYEKAVDAYEEAYAAYEAKCERDRVREEMDTKTCTLRHREWFYYDGTQTVSLMTDVIDYPYDYSDSDRTPMLMFCAPTDAEQKVLMSGITSYYDVEYIDSIADYAADGCTLYAAIGGQVQPVAELDVTPNFLTFRPDGSALLYRSISDGALMTAEISGGMIDQPELEYQVDSVYDCIWSEWSGNKLYDVRYNDDYTELNLYCDGELIAEGVPMYMSGYDVCDDRVVYLTDWDLNKEKGTLRIYDGKETQVIAEDVHSFVCTKDGIAYLGEYSARRCAGDLYYFNGRKSVPVDQDVTQLYYVVHDHVYYNYGSYDASWLGY